MQSKRGSSRTREEAMVVVLSQLLSLYSLHIRTNRSVSQPLRWWRQVFFLQVRRTTRDLKERIKDSNRVKSRVPRRGRGLGSLASTLLAGLTTASSLRKPVVPGIRKTPPSKRKRISPLMDIIEAKRRGRKVVVKRKGITEGSTSKTNSRCVTPESFSSDTGLIRQETNEHSSAGSLYPSSHSPKYSRPRAVNFNAAPVKAKPWLKLVIPEQGNRTEQKRTFLPYSPTLVDIPDSPSDSCSETLAFEAPLELVTTGSSPSSGALISEKDVEICLDLPNHLENLTAPDTDEPSQLPEIDEYLEEITNYEKEREQRTLPDPDYMDNHPELDWGLRDRYIKWVGLMYHGYKFRPETYFLFVNIFDRFLSLAVLPIRRSNMALSAIACFCIAYKYEETKSPSLGDMLRQTNHWFDFSQNAIREMESRVLNTLKFDVSFAGPMDWLWRGSKGDGLEPRARNIARYLLEVTTYEEGVVEVPPSLQAAACLWFARLTLGRENWNSGMIQHTGYEEHKVITVANKILNYISQCDFFCQTWPEDLDCSLVIRRWTKRLSKGEPAIDLNASLPRVKAAIRKWKVAKLDAAMESE
ncbi:G2/mitotic-specific cyclin [Marasmius sp. AFHP31]|nr:G2/mitotic-specific cyclin [Marasmius sp. AFHP31]